MQGDGKLKVALTFGLYEGHELTRRETVIQDIVKVGRDPKSHLRVDDELASRMHAVIEVASARDITLIDLGNEPGTIVNGARINKCKIQPGDHIQIGHTLLVLERADVVAAPLPKPLVSVGALALAHPSSLAQDASGMRDDAPLGSYTYTLVKSGPAVNPDEVELGHVTAVEVVILWDTTVLHVQHLNPPRSFYVGEEEGSDFACDYFIPSEKIGTTRAPIVLADHGNIRVVILPRARGTVEIPGLPKMTLDEAVRCGREPGAEPSEAREIALPSGAKVRMEMNGLVFQIAAVPAGRPLGHGPFAGTDTNTALYVGMSLLAHIGLIAIMAFFVPPLGLNDEEGRSRDQAYLIQQYLAAAAEREHEEKETEQVAEANADNREGGTGTRAKGEEGSMGNPHAKETIGRFGVEGPKDNQDRHVARHVALRDVAEFGMIGLLHNGAGGDPNAPTAPWGRDDSLGQDPLSARGNMWGESIGDSFGAGGLGLSGIGEAGGGIGEGIGLGQIGTIGRGAGTGAGQGIGSGQGRLGGFHSPRPPQVRPGATTINGRLPPEVIQRIVRQNYGRFRLCYENGLRSNPNLEGRVEVRFVIDRQGAVSNVSNGGSDLPDAGVVACVIRAYYGLSFPQPEGGIVTVVYPIVFSPGD